VKCPTCSAEIADKAIVCYRCGTPTAIPAAPVRPAARQGRGRLFVLIVVLVLATAVLLFTYLSRS
jgi:hypothetical protein